MVALDDKLRIHQSYIFHPEGGHECLHQMLWQSTQSHDGGAKESQWITKVIKTHNLGTTAVGTKVADRVIGKPLLPSIELRCYWHTHTVCKLQYIEGKKKLQYMENAHDCRKYKKIFVII